MYSRQEIEKLVFEEHHGIVVYYLDGTVRGCWYYDHSRCCMWFVGFNRLGGYDRDEKAYHHDPYIIYKEHDCSIGTNILPVDDDGIPLISNCKSVRYI